ncbi:MAG: hypothetical protein HY820_44190 [Acidobacteria bacterium]|nr:hypothetical protein [Acidobacteriota bacterium]
MGRLRLFVFFAVTALGLSAQVIEFESGGLKYKTLTHNGVTVMFAHLPSHVRGYAIIQVAVSNGSQLPWAIKVNDFQFERDGAPLQPAKPKDVVNELIDKAGRADVVKLVSTYEMGLYGMSRMNSTNGYEQRRQAAFTMLTSARIKAAAAASAIAFVDTRLTPGQSTDGAIFYANAGKPLAGKLVVKVAGEVFEFPAEQTAP